MTTRQRVTWLLMAIGLAWCAGAAPPASAEARSDDKIKQGEQPDDKEPGAKRDGLGSLDELLGLERPESNDPAESPTQTDLKRRLSGRELGDALRQAVSLMGQAAQRLRESGDAGIDTQRVQEDAVRKLDELLAALEQQQQSGGGEQSQQGDSDARQAPRNQGRAQRPGSEAGRGENRGEVGLPGRQEGTLRPQLDAARSAWGALPERVRDALRQGSGDKFSSMYERLTGSYYRRLAEEAGRANR